MEELIRSLGRLVVITLVAATPLVIANIASASAVTTLSGEGISSAVSSVSHLLVSELGHELGSSRYDPVDLSRCERYQALAGLESPLR